MSWTEERTGILRKLWAQGLSGAQIARELGGLTRNAVFGKLSRLKIIGTDRKPVKAEQRRPVAPRRTPQRRRGFDHSHARPLPDLPIEVVELPADSSPDACTLLELDDTRCRWPMGEPGTEDFRFCGSPPVAGCPYCPRHARLAYQPGQRRDVRPFYGRGAR